MACVEVPNTGPLPEPVSSLPFRAFFGPGVGGAAGRCPVLHPFRAAILRRSREGGQSRPRVLAGQRPRPSSRAGAGRAFAGSSRGRGRTAGRTNQQSVCGAPATAPPRATAGGGAAPARLVSRGNAAHAPERSSGRGGNVGPP